VKLTAHRLAPRVVWSPIASNSIQIEVKDDNAAILEVPHSIGSEQHAKREKYDKVNVLQEVFAEARLKCKDATTLNLICKRFDFYLSNEVPLDAIKNDLEAILIQEEDEDLTAILIQEVSINLYNI